MIIIVLVCIASAALFGWLMIELGRLALGEFRVPRPAIGLLRESAGATEIRPGADVPEAPAAPVEDVEQLVRERLYGERNGALRRGPAANE